MNNEVQLRGPEIVFIGTRTEGGLDFVWFPVRGVHFGREVGGCKKVLDLLSVYVRQERI